MNLYKFTSVCFDPNCESTYVVNSGLTQPGGGVHDLFLFFRPCATPRPVVLRLASYEQYFCDKQQNLCENGKDTRVLGGVKSLVRVTKKKRETSSDVDRL